MQQPFSIAVFCGSRPGNDPRHLEGATALGAEMAKRGARLVYGGGRVGLMGAVADAVLEGGGEVVGVIPDFLMRREVGHEKCTELEVTDSMHSRKRRMFELADAFVSLSGGIGTLDETVEIITWRQLGLHDKPIVILNNGGYWDMFKTLHNEVIAAGFAYERDHHLYAVVESVSAVFEVLDKAPEPKLETPSDRL